MLGNRQHNESLKNQQQQCADEVCMHDCVLQHAHKASSNLRKPLAACKAHDTLHVHVSIMPAGQPMQHTTRHMYVHPHILASLGYTRQNNLLPH